MPFLTGLADLLLGLVGAVAVRALAALGITLLSWGGVSALIDELIQSFQSQYNTIPVDMLALLNLAGVGDVFGIIFGAFVVKAGFKALHVFASSVA